MSHSRRDTLLAILLAPVGSAAVIGLSGAQQDQNPDDRTLPVPPSPDNDQKLPNGKSQRDEIAREEHTKALKEADELVQAAEDLRDQLKRAGDFTVPLGSVRKTEEIEKLARKIRGRLKN